jgi:DNA primase
MPSKHNRNDAGQPGIRLSVRLLVLGSLLIIVAAILLPRPGTTKAPAQAGAQASNAPDYHPIARARRSAESVRETSVATSTETGWTHDLETTNARERLRELREREATNGSPGIAEQQVLEELRERREREATNRIPDPAEQQVLDKLRQRREREALAERDMSVTNN